MSIKEVQGLLVEAGHDPGPADGMWGPRTETALRVALGLSSIPPLAWGAKVSPAFRAKVRALASRLGAPADDLMAAMAFETGRTFSPSVRNAAGSGATGLIQFMPATARSLGTSTDALAKMTAERQLDYVEGYFRPYRGRLKDLGDLYMAILWPAGIGKPDDWTLWDRDSRPTTYRQNAGLDLNRDGKITRGEALAKVSSFLSEGRLPHNAA